MAGEHLTTPEDMELFLETLAAVAPGTGLRDGLSRILLGGTGALIVLGFDDTVAGLCSGGFAIDVEFTPMRLRELAKMDGAVLLNADASRILQAAVHLLPDGSLPTNETGTRHRTADRVSQQTGYPVVTVSGSMKTIALYIRGRRHVLEDSTAILSRANQAIATMERYKLRMDEVSHVLSGMEIEDMATVRDVAAFAQRLEMVRRIASEIHDYVIELGSDGRLLSLQHAELVAGVDEVRVLLVRDYSPESDESAVDKALFELDQLNTTDLLELDRIAGAIGLDSGVEGLDQAVNPRGYRLLASVPRLPDFVVDRLVDHFGNMQHLVAASIDQLQDVEGIGDTRARSIRESLSRLVETNFR